MNLENLITGSQVALWAANYLQQFWSAVESQTANVQDVTLQSRWAPPALGSCKINVDGSLFPAIKMAGIGVVIRDLQGRLLAALCRKIQALMGVLEIEAKAYEAGVLLARHLGLTVGILEGDSFTISNALKQASVPPISIAAIVEGIQALSSEIGVIEYSPVRRKGNQPAHVLARQALSIVNDVIWIEETPYCI